MNISEVFKMISQSEMDALMTAFEEGVSYFILLDNNLWVGVNTDSIPNLIPTQIEGNWRLGHFNPSESNNDSTVTRSLYS